jgi:hypothetical protein
VDVSPGAGVGMMASTHRAAWALVVGAVMLSLGLTVEAQRGGGRQRGGFDERFQTMAQIEGNVPYDGRFTFVRLMYRSFGRGGTSWAHDYPRGERHFMKIVNAVSLLNPHMDESNILALDDPELFKYPVAYMAEPGFWNMSEAELAGLKEYIAKGGFLIFDDFRFEHWYNFEAQINRVFPKAIWHEMKADHPIFHSFYDIDSLDLIPQYFQNYGTPIFRGLFEDNDPTKRLIAIANYNTDLSEFWEYADTGLQAVADTNEAFKLGVNYLIYGLTH